MEEKVGTYVGATCGSGIELPVEEKVGNMWELHVENFQFKAI